MRRIFIVLRELKSFDARGATIPISAPPTQLPPDLEVIATIVTKVSGLSCNLLIEMKSVDRVRCVLKRRHRFLLAQHYSRRPDKIGKWGLPGGRLKGSEEPQAGLRRELLEELRLSVPYLIELGDCQHRGHTHRIFGCEIDSLIDWFDMNEILDIGWFTHDEVAGMAEADRLRTGFELGAISAFRRRVQPLIDSSELWPQRRRRGRGVPEMPWAEL